MSFQLMDYLFNIFKYFYFYFRHIEHSASMFVCAPYVYQVPQDVGSPRPGVTVSCEFQTNNVDTGNQTWLLWKSSQCS